MKIITYSRVGYNAPSGANWSYGIWQVSLINTDNPYHMSYTVKENFGGECRFKDALEELGVTASETKGVYTSTGTQKITGVSSMESIESKEFIKEVSEWYNK